MGTHNVNELLRCTVFCPTQLKNCSIASVLIKTRKSIINNLEAYDPIVYCIPYTFLTKASKKYKNSLRTVANRKQKASSMI